MATRIRLTGASLAISTRLSAVTSETPCRGILLSKGLVKRRRGKNVKGKRREAVMTLPPSSGSHMTLIHCNFTLLTGGGYDAVVGGVGPGRDKGENKIEVGGKRGRLKGM